MATVLTLEQGLVPPIANLDSLPDGFDLDCVVKEPRTQHVERALSHFGFGGHNVALAFQRVEPDGPRRTAPGVLAVG